MRPLIIGLLAAIIWMVNGAILVGCAWSNQQDERAIYMKAVSPAGCICECVYDKKATTNDRETAGVLK